MKGLLYLVHRSRGLEGLTADVLSERISHSRLPEYIRASVVATIVGLASSWVPGMSHSTILPPFRFGRDDNYRSLSSNPANRFIFRVHSATGDGALIPHVGFVPHGSSTLVNDSHHTASWASLSRAAKHHVTQWTNKTRDTSSIFVSASYSISYALFEARRRDFLPSHNQPHISIIDTSKIKSDAWLAAELIDDWMYPKISFAQCAQEILVCGGIPYNAVVITMPMDEFFDCLPGWCDGFKLAINPRRFWTSEAVASALAWAAKDPANNTADEEATLVHDSATRSIGMLRHLLPASMAE
ncbi:hypothetical protein C8R44DRAFT_877898 [Mycena epipterygia]|nr:hypothetical protein C8R44DRAFT_877898 [Mycena epipterygia]